MGSGEGDWRTRENRQRWILDPPTCGWGAPPAAQAKPVQIRSVPGSFCTVGEVYSTALVGWTVGWQKGGFELAYTGETPEDPLSSLPAYKMWGMRGWNELAWALLGTIMAQDHP